ncbi:hypothetical protein N7495_000541 [Penicillium taxi]|uniref:uncharacterized protein n=1 Tax=Penicillium taxi TaxID=168475 RepID=UPI002544E620|nr:uncharacterized protein N7495_000541 [Penicillium taxi]KAJ5907859.1 hypothetical protein N7495_000541 [Penicillium taxi]
MVQVLVPYLPGAAPATLADGLCRATLSCATYSSYRLVAFSNSIRSIAAHATPSTQVELLLVMARLLLSVLKWGSFLLII